MNRRQFLQLSTAVGVTGLGGCLQLTSDTNSQPSTSTEATPTQESSTSRTTQPSPIALEEVTRLSPAGGDIARHQEDFFINDTLNEHSKSEKGFVWRVNKNGEVAWQVPHSQSLHQQQPVTHSTSDSIYWGYRYLDFLASNDERVAKLVRRSLDTGEKHWEFTGNPNDSNNLVGGITQPSPGVIAFGTSGIGVNYDEATPTIYGVDTETGTERWKTTLSSGFIRTLLMHDGTLTAVAAGNIYQIPPGGPPEHVLETSEATNSLSRRGSRLYFGQSELACVDLASMSKRWTTGTPGRLTTTTTTDQGLFVGTETGFVARFNPDTGKKLWEHRVNTTVYTLQTTPGFVWVPDDGTLKALRVSDGTPIYEANTAASPLETIDETLCYIAGSNAILQHITNT